MGQTLSEPITEKHSESGQSDHLLYGLSAMQGWRLSMEDAHIAVTQLPKTDKKLGFFGVYDGHGGEKTAKYVGEHLTSIFVDLPEFQQEQYDKAFKRLYFKTDEILREAPEVKDDQSGCTAVSALITPTEIICANAGDSRCIIGVDGKVFAMSNDHKPTLKEENDRIVSAGGFVEFGRVNGNLALSRALGDFDFKSRANLPAEQQVVTANPEIITYPVSDSVHFCLLACDGIWDCMTNQEVCDFVQVRIAAEKQLSVICEELITNCLAPEATLGSQGCDNMSVILVAILNGKSKEEWLARCKQSAASLAPLPAAVEVKQPVSSE